MQFVLTIEADLEILPNFRSIIPYEKFMIKLIIRHNEIVFFLLIQFVLILSIVNISLNF